MAKEPEKKTESKADKFVRLAERRVGKALKAINQCQSLANKNAYEFDENQAVQIAKALNQASQNVAESFKAALEGKKAKAETGFSFIKGSE